MLSYYLFSFESSNRAMAAEINLGQLEGVRLIPLPPEIHAGCGLVLKVAKEKIDEVVSILKDKNIEVEGAYYFEQGEYKKLDLF